MGNGGSCGRAAAGVVMLALALGACAAEDEPDAALGSATDRGESGSSSNGAAGRSAVVTRVIDGDTVELGDGRTVRLIGIDTPERGECGYDEATEDLIRLVEGRTVRLTRVAEDTDRYDRLLRYLDVDGLDAGLRLIENGRAIARYDSRDGYGFHPREPRYVAADEAQQAQSCS